MELVISFLLIVGGIFVASMLHFSTRGAGLSLHELLVAGFLLFTAPVSAHLIARTMLHLGASDDAGPAERRHRDEGEPPCRDRNHCG